MTREEINILIAKDLLKIKAVFFRPDEPFTWASGIKSPVYCDNRLTLTAPEVRTDVEKGLAQLIGEEYPAAKVLMGTSTAGIAHAAFGLAARHVAGLKLRILLQDSGEVISGLAVLARTQVQQGSVVKRHEVRRVALEHEVKVADGFVVVTHFGSQQAAVEVGLLARGV